MDNHGQGPTMRHSLFRLVLASVMKANNIAGQHIRLEAGPERAEARISFLNTGYARGAYSIGGGNRGTHMLR